MNLLKDVRIIYDSYVPKIYKGSNGLFKCNLNEENIFGNLNYSMNNSLLKRKQDELGSSDSESKIKRKKEKMNPVKLIPILRFKSN